MTQAFDPAVECTGREKMTHSQALDAARRMKFKATPYQCRGCGKWHLGAANKKSGKQRRKGRR